MSTAQTLGLGAIAGLTIFLGLPIGRMQSVKPATKAFLAATATGILIFLLWDVLSQAVSPVEDALTNGRDGRFAWLAFLLAAGFLAGLMSLVYYDLWMKRRRRRAFLGPGGGLDPLRRDGAAERRPCPRVEASRHLGNPARVVSRVRDRLHPRRCRRLACV